MSVRAWSTVISTFSSGSSRSSGAQAGQRRVSAAWMEEVMRMVPPFPHLAQGEQLRLDVAQRRAQGAEQPLARLGGRHAARGPRQQADAEPRFQAADGVAQRGLGDAELGGRAGEAVFLGHGEEDVEVGQLIAVH
jgi:hypothetical protein